MEIVIQENCFFLLFLFFS